MKWVTVEHRGQERVGLVEAGTVHLVPAPTTLIDLLGDDGTRLRAAAEVARESSETIELADARLMAPIPRPPSVRDFMAFEAHVRNCRSGDVDRGWYEAPVFYFTNPAAIGPAHGSVEISPGSSQFDFELEVAAVIGLPGENIRPEDAERHIAGYTVLCDWSARDLQAVEMVQRLGPAKGKDSATSLGPYLVTPDELADVARDGGYDLAMRASVNGAEQTNGNWSSIHWTFAQMIAYASRGTELRAGDVIGSGTVGFGCLLEQHKTRGSAAHRWLLPGDRVHLSIERLGDIDVVVAPAQEVVPLS